MAHSLATPSTISPRHWAMFMGLATIYGSSFLFIKMGVETIPPMTLVLIRLTLAAAMLTGIAWMNGLHLPRLRAPSGKPSRHWTAFVVLAITGNSLPFTLISWGSQSVPSSLAGILMAVMPLATMGLAALFVSGESVTLRRLTGFIIGFIGMLVLFGADVLGLAASYSILAQIVIVSAALCYASNAVLTKNMPPCNPIVAAAGIHICAALIMVPCAFIFENPLAIAPSAASLFSALTLAVASSGVATILLLQLIRDVGPTFTSQLNYLVPLWAVVFGFLFLGEVPRWNAAAALVLILAGIALSQSRARA